MRGQFYSIFCGLSMANEESSLLFIKFKIRIGIEFDRRDAAAPRMVYLISRSSSHGKRIKRLLRAVYHPRNQYRLHLDEVAYDVKRITLRF